MRLLAISESTMSSARVTSFFMPVPTMIEIGGRRTNYVRIANKKLLLILCAVRSTLQGGQRRHNVEAYFLIHASNLLLRNPRAWEIGDRDVYCDPHIAC